MAGMINSQTCPELRTAPRIWICVDTESKTITSTRDSSFEVGHTRVYTDEDFAEQLTTAVVEERMK